MKKPFDRNEFVKEVPQVELIEDPAIREGVIRAWELAYADSAFEDFRCRFSCEYDANITLPQHIRSVAQRSYDCAKQIVAEYGFTLRLDYVLAIALVHDLCKLRDNVPTGDTVDKSEDGHQMPHAFFSAFYALNAGLPTEIASGALTHSHHTKKVPTCLEAVIVSYMDLAETDVFRWIWGRELNIEAIHKDPRLC